MINTETETVVKKIIPYLQRRGYDIVKDLNFETCIKLPERYSNGYVDILVTCGKKSPLFLIEAKRINKNLTQKDRDQAIEYARSKDINVLFVVITNGHDIQCFNVKNKNRILWDGKSQDKIPNKEQLKKVISTLKTNPDETNISISNDSSLPFRAGLALRQLNSLFYRCHSAIRKIEKNEENAFSDFSKLLFLKLLEEKSDLDEGFLLPYSYKFHELALKPDHEADQIKDSILNMIQYIVKQKSYGEVLEDKIKLKNPKTFKYIVKELSNVSFCDCSLDSKGAAFEYFVRATLKGKKLGQYFTPRELVEVMISIVGRNKIINSLLLGNQFKVLDPSCGTGGFLVFLMQDAINQINTKYNNREIQHHILQELTEKIKKDTFFGSDANEGVAASAKMNMIISGDGHTNIQHEDSLSLSAKNWNIDYPDCDLILTNPPFGTVETASLSKDDLKQFDIKNGKGQSLFIQKMIKCLKNGTGEICTVIDEGILNNDNSKPLRKWIMENCKIKAIVNLPSDTFKPNKINVRSSLLYLEKREMPDVDLDDNYSIPICSISSLGYLGSGEKIRGFDIKRLLNELSTELFNKESGTHRSGYNWESFDILAKEINEINSYRFDFKYWNLNVKDKILELEKKGKNISQINKIKTSRGKSPSADNYVDEKDGYAVVIKSGSNITKFGTVSIENSDWIEKSLYDEYIADAKTKGDNNALIKKGDILLSSTGDGTLGKSAVYELDIPAIADGHVTIIRVNQNEIDPYYLCDYLRNGFGNIQIERLYTGSTGMIELTPTQVDSIIVDIIPITEQRAISRKLRKLEKEYLNKIQKADEILAKAKKIMN